MTIPATNSQYLITKDWKKIYQSYPNAEFQSYDFETLRRIMIAYLQENFPEDFNDFIDSSEYIALVDLIAYLGQNLSFRIDLNARENFLETATRRDSILRLAQLISYVPSRNMPANGLLKMSAISTTDNVYDSLGNNLSNTTIGWNDATNANWYNQFLTILNSSFIAPQVFGNPSDQNSIGGILTQQYRINSSNTDVAVYSFTKNISGSTMPFEIVSTTFSGKSYLYEEAPEPGNRFAIIYQNDNQGNSSANTGFFSHFRQGQLGSSIFSIPAPVPNEIIGVNITNINNDDVWLWHKGLNGQYQTLWTKVPALTGNNVIYNSLNATTRNFYSVTTRDGDQIDLNFSDGSFGNLPTGDFGLFYRQSNGLTYSITPSQMTGISVSIPYVNKSGQNQTMTITYSLEYTVSNSQGTESNTSIQTNAPQTYYTQNRMVTGEDYNIAPLNISSEILKVKSIARVTSGVSKYFELSDVSGKYSSTNIFADDGILYKNLTQNSFDFNFNSKNDIYSIVQNRLTPIIASATIRSFYLDEYPRPDLTQSGVNWVQVTKSSGQSTGYFANISTNVATAVGGFSNSNLAYIAPGSLIKFVPPAGQYFLPNGTLVNKRTSTTVDYIWSLVSQIVGDGSNNGTGALSTGVGPITLNIVVPSTAAPVEIIPAFVNSFSSSFITEIVNLCLIQRNFGLSFDSINRVWNIIADSNLNLVSPFSLEYQNNTSNSNLDSSWLVAFAWNGTSYTVQYRQTDYVFQSAQQTGFFIDSNNVNYDFTTNTIIKDKIKVLSVNTLNTTSAVALGTDYLWQIDGTITQSDGYVEPRQVLVSFYDYNNSGQIVDPDAFELIVSSTSTNEITGWEDKFVYFQLQADKLTYELVDSGMFTAYPTPADAIIAINSGTITPSTGDLFYFYDSNYNVINSYNTSTANINNPWIYDTTASTYVAYPGRSEIKFQYVHNTGQDTRIDPSKSNIIDIYMLTSDYDTAFRNWLLTGNGTEPLPPTSVALENNYAGSLEPIKTISDQIIYQPVKYKVLFGATADLNLQATFKAVQSPTSTLSSNNIKSQILSAINRFFALENWDFGQSFYFSELSAYIMNLLTPDITNFVIVPVNPNNNFGSLYEVACQNNEIFVSGATAADIQVITAITASQLDTKSIITNAGN
jgi:hypothetical protein